MQETTWSGGLLLGVLSFKETSIPCIHLRMHCRLMGCSPWILIMSPTHVQCSRQNNWKKTVEVRLGSSKPICSISSSEGGVARKLQVNKLMTPAYCACNYPADFKQRLTTVVTICRFLRLCHTGNKAVFPQAFLTRMSNIPGSPPLQSSDTSNIHLKAGLLSCRAGLVRLVSLCLSRRNLRLYDIRWCVQEGTDWKQLSCKENTVLSDQNSPESMQL